MPPKRISVGRQKPYGKSRRSMETPEQTEARLLHQRLQQAGYRAARRQKQQQADARNEAERKRKANGSFVYPMTSADRTNVTIFWKNHGEFLSKSIEDFYRSQFLVDTDVTITGDFVKAHRLILAIFLPTFKRNADNTLNGLNLEFVTDEIEDLRALVEFVYTGKVTVPNYRLKHLGRLADSLQFQQLSNVIRQLDKMRVRCGGGDRRRGANIRGDGDNSRGEGYNSHGKSENIRGQGDNSRSEGDNFRSEGDNDDVERRPSDDGTLNMTQDEENEESSETPAMHPFQEPEVTNDVATGANSSVSSIIDYEPQFVRPDVSTVNNVDMPSDKYEEAVRASWSSSPLQKTYDIQHMKRSTLSNISDAVSSPTEGIGHLDSELTNQDEQESILNHEQADEENDNDNNTASMQEQSSHFFYPPTIKQEPPDYWDVTAPSIDPVMSMVIKEEPLDVDHLCPRENAYAKRPRPKRTIDDGDYSSSSSRLNDCGIAINNEMEFGRPRPP